LSVYSSYTTDNKPITQGKKLAVSLAIFIVSALIAAALLFVNPLLSVIVVFIGLGGSIVKYRKSRFEHKNIYVGTEGIALYYMGEKKEVEDQSRVILYSDVHEFLRYMYFHNNDSSRYGFALMSARHGALLRKDSSGSYYDPYMWGKLDKKYKVKRANDSMFESVEIEIFKITASIIYEQQLKRHLEEIETIGRTEFNVYTYSYRHREPTMYAKVLLFVEQIVIERDGQQEVYRFHELRTLTVVDRVLNVTLKAFTSNYQLTASDKYESLDIRAMGNLQVFLNILESVSKDYNIERYQINPMSDFFKYRRDRGR
jgi:hypothetical protein